MVLNLVQKLLRKYPNFKFGFNKTNFTTELVIGFQFVFAIRCVCWVCTGNEDMQFAFS